MTFSNESFQAEKSKRFLTLLNALMATKGIDPNENMVLGYALALSDLTDDQLQNGFVRALREVDGMPSPAKIRELAGVNVDTDTKAVDAWGDVLKAIPKGSYVWPDFGDQRINATIRNLGGWPNFLSRLDGAEGEKWARHEFLKTYAAIGDTLSPEACRPLQGLGEKRCIGGQMRDPIVRIECANAERRTAIEHRPAGPVTLQIASFRNAN